MSDTTLIRNLAGPHFQLADTLRHERAEPTDKGMERFLLNLAGWLPHQRLGRGRIDRNARLIFEYAEGLKTLSVEEIRIQFQSALQTLKTATADQQALTVIFACVGEGSRRTLGMWPHPVQFAGAHVLLTGRLAEMQTGEGKTLVAGLAATVMAGSGAYVHVVSTNDYLAERDSHEMRPLFQFFGLDSSAIKDGMEIPERQTAYRFPICYASGKEIVFDYLKDRLAGHGVLPKRVMHVRQAFATDNGEQLPIIPALHFSIVDEADSVMIDEAKTPMVISRDAESMMEPAILNWAMQQAKRLQEGRDFRLSPAQHDVEIFPIAMSQIDALPSEVKTPVWQSVAWQQMILRQALVALHLYHLDEHYIIAEDKVQIVDDSTGRVMADRSWEQGLHQLIETKEGVELTSGRDTLARMTFQRFFRRYFLLSGLTGTGMEVKRELWSVYRLKVCAVPPNKPKQRKRLQDHCYADFEKKWPLVAQDAIRAAERGQPVLIGTRSVESSEQVSAELMRLGVEHVVLNARQDADEAQLVAAAGQAGRITVATNMAGRGTDIKLTDAAKQAGGLHVILTEFHESARIDRQLFGRSGRQGEPGTIRAMVSCQDALLLHDGGLLRVLLTQLEPGFIQRILMKMCVWSAQYTAGQRAYTARLQTLKQDRKLSQQIGFAGKTI